MYNILVVDDERIHREGLIMLLEKICPDDMLWEASNGQEAMEIMNNISCEIVISDIRMAEMDGLQLQKKSKNRLSRNCICDCKRICRFFLCKRGVTVSCK